MYKMASSNPISWLNEYSAKHLRCAKLEDEYKQRGLMQNMGFVCNLKLSHLTGRGEGMGKKEAKHNAALAIVQQLNPEMENLPVKVPTKDNDKSNVSSNSKGSLQELCQKNLLSIPEYNIVKKEGPDHSLQFTIECTVKDGSGKILHQTRGTSSAKRGAEIEAAILMKEKIQKTLPGGTITSRSGQEPDPMEQDSSNREILGAGNAKGNLQHICQKNMLLIPEYKLVDRKGPSHDLQFSVLCTVRDTNKDIVKKVFGNGASKRQAEVDAAMRMKAEIETLLPSIIEGVGPMKKTVPRQGLEEPDGDSVMIDELISIVMSKSFHMPDILTEQSEPVDSSDLSTMKYLCIASAEHIDPAHVVSSYELYRFPIASQGIGVTEEEAKRDALLNLISNIDILIKA